MRNVGVDGEVYCHLFFQAEDGIRDLTVTGVQTCALPISSAWSGQEHRPRGQAARTEERRLLRLWYFGLPVEMATPKNSPEIRINRDEIVRGRREDRKSVV